MVLPLVLLLSVAYLWPLGRMVLASLDGDGLSNYSRFFSDDLFTRTLTRTLKLSALTGIASVFMGYPIAALMVRVGPRARLFVMALVFIPLWTSAVIRSYAWVAVLRPDGLLDKLVGLLGFAPFDGRLLNTETAIVLGSVTILIPVAVVPTYAALAAVDPRLPLAARSLGAGRWQVWRHVTFPHTRVAIGSSMLVVFLVSTGYYVTAALLGGPRNLVISTLIAQEITLFNLPFASAISVLLTIGAMSLGALAFAVARRAGGAR